MSGDLEDLRLLGQKAHRLGDGLGRLSRHDAAAGATRLQLPGDDGHRWSVWTPRRSRPRDARAPRRRACMTSRTEG